MFERRMAKLKLIEREIPPDEKIIYYGPRDAKRIIVGWGSTKPAILTALNELRDVGFLYIKMLYPFPADLVKKHLESKETMFVENNYLGQLAMITRMFAGIEPTSIAVKYNGRPITTDDVLDAYRKFEAGEKVIKIDTDL